MTLANAREKIERGAPLPELAEAIGVLISDRDTPLDTLLQALKYRGFVAEQAAFALYRRTGRPLPERGADLVTDAQEWSCWLSDAGRELSPDRS